MNRVQQRSSEGLPVAPPGGESVPITVVRHGGQIGKLATNFTNSGLRSLDVIQTAAPPGNEYLNPTTAPRPGRPRLVRRVTATVAAAGVTLASAAACGSEKKDVTLTNNTPKPSSEPNPHKSSQEIDLSKPIVIKKLCSLATAKEAYTIYNKVDGAYLGCDEGPDESDPVSIDDAVYSGGDAPQVDSVSVRLDKASDRSAEAIREGQQVSFNGVTAWWSPAGGTLTMPLRADNRVLTVWTDSMETDRLSYDERLQRTEEFATLLLERATGQEPQSAQPLQGDVSAPVQPPDSPYPSISGFQPSVE